MIRIYTGVLYKTKESIGVWTSVMNKDGDLKILTGNVVHHQSNKLFYSAQKLELLAILESLLSLKKENNIIIKTSSDYIFQSISKEKFKDWVINETKENKDLDLWTLYYNLNKIHSISVELCSQNPSFIQNKIDRITLEELSNAMDFKSSVGETQKTRRVALDFKTPELTSKSKDFSIEELFLENSKPFDKENVESYERQKSVIISPGDLKYNYNDILKSLDSNKKESSGVLEFSLDMLPKQNISPKKQNDSSKRKSSRRSPKKKQKGYYAVAKGRTVGVCTSWDECKKRTVKFKGAIFKKFNTEEEAINFIKMNR